MTAGTPPNLPEALTAALGTLETKPQDVAAVALAHRYAEQIEADPSLLTKLGPGLLSVLESLAMTPRGRALVTGKGGPPRDNPGKSRLDLQRERRAARLNGAAVVDPASS